jgi:Ca2+-binding RTX toxin-like protein
LAHVTVSGTGFNFERLFQLSLSDTSSQNSAGAGTSTELVVQNGFGGLTTLQGAGFVYDSTENLMSGTISGFTVTDSASVLGVTVTDLSLEVSVLLSAQSRNNYGSVLGSSWSLEAIDGNSISTDSFGGNDWSDIIRQTTGDISIIATDNGDFFQTSGGNDFLDASGGNDQVHGSGGDDTIFGGAGSDFITGGQGNDTIYGGDGNDRIGLSDMTIGSDIIDGGDGHDTVFLSRDVIDSNFNIVPLPYTFTQSGNDILVHVGVHTTVLRNVEEVGFGEGVTTPVSELLFDVTSLVETGTSNADTIEGQAGDDILHGLGSADLLVGNGGNDELRGGHGNDTLDGGDGDDFLIGFATAINRTANTDGNDTLYGGNGNDRIIAGAGNDRLFGDAGSDELNGLNGSDFLSGGAGNDRLFGGVREGDLRDAIFGGDGDDYAEGGYGNDFIKGESGNDTLIGGFGVDTILGNEGDDTIAGSAWSDLIFGGTGADFINGGFGFDRINGGTGGDRFFHLGILDHGSDWIQDYNSSEGDVLIAGIRGATRNGFQINFNDAVAPNGEAAGDDNTQEAFVIYRPTGQILWALIDGAGQSEINIQLDGIIYDLMV